MSKVYELQTTPVSLRIDKCLSDPEDTISTSRLINGRELPTKKSDKVQEGPLGG